MSDSARVLANPALASFAEALDAASKVGPLSTKVDHIAAQNTTIYKDLELLRNAINQVAVKCIKTSQDNRDHSKTADLDLRQRIEQQAGVIADQNRRYNLLHAEFLQQQQALTRQTSELDYLKNNWERLTFALDSRFMDYVNRQNEDLKKFKERVVEPLVALIQEAAPDGTIPTALGQSTSDLLSSVQPAPVPLYTAPVPSAPSSAPPAPNRQLTYLPDPSTAAPAQPDAGPSRAANSPVQPTHRTQRASATAVETTQDVLDPAAEKARILAAHGSPVVRQVSNSGRRSASVSVPPPGVAQSQSVSTPVRLHAAPRDSPVNGRNTPLTNGHNRPRRESDDEVEFVSERGPTGRVRPAHGIITVKQEPGTEPEGHADIGAPAETSAMAAPEEMPMQVAETQDVVVSEPPMQVIETDTVVSEQANAAPNGVAQGAAASLAETRLPPAEPRIETSIVEPQSEAEVEMEVDAPHARRDTAPTRSMDTAPSAPQPATAFPETSRGLNALPPIPRRLSRELFSPAVASPTTSSTVDPSREAVQMDARISPSGTDASATDPRSNPFTVYVYYGEETAPSTPSMIYNDLHAPTSYISRKLADILLQRGLAKHVNDPTSSAEKIEVDLYIRCNEMVPTKAGRLRAPVRPHTLLPGVVFEIRPRYELDGVIISNGVFHDKNLAIKHSTKKDGCYILVQNGTGQGSALFQYPEEELEREHTSRYSRACALAEYAFHRTYQSNAGAKRRHDSDDQSVRPLRNSLSGNADTRYADHNNPDLLTRLDSELEHGYPARSRGPPADSRNYDERQQRYVSDDVRNGTSHRPGDRRQGSTFAARLQSPTRQPRYEGRADREYDSYNGRASCNEREETPLTDQSSDFIVEEPDEDELDEAAALPLAARLLPEREQRRVQQERRLAARRRAGSAESDNETSGEETLSLRRRRL